jgi:hypothetical protein
MSILLMDICFILKNMSKIKRHNGGGSNSNEFEIDYYEKLEEVIELYYHCDHNKIFLFKCYWYDTIDRGIEIDPQHGLVKINSKARLRNVDDVFVFAKQCQQVYYTYIPSFKKNCLRADWLSMVKTKSVVVSRLFRKTTMN